MLEHPQADGQAVQFEQFVKEAKDHHQDFLSCATDSLKSAALCGQALIRARDAVKHGDWMATLRLYWKEMSKSTAYRYIEVAEKFHTVGNLAGMTLRGFLSAVNQAPETTNTETKPIVINLGSVERMSQKFELKRDEVLTWPEDKRNALKVALKPIAEVYEALNDVVIDISADHRDANSVEAN